MSHIFMPQNPGIGGLDALTDAEELFIQNLAGLTYAQGDIIYYDGTNLNVLAAGTDGYFLKTQGAGANPVWAANPSGGVSKVGTPVDNQIGIWTGDGTIEGVAGLTYDGNTLSSIGTAPQLKVGTSTTNGTQKYSSIVQPKYNTSASDFGLVIGASTGTANSLRLGGGNASFHAATDVTIYTAANDATNAGTARLTVSSDGDVTLANGSGLNLQEDITFTGATTENLIKFPDNLANALTMGEATNAYITFVSTDGSEAVSVAKKLALSSNGLTISGTSTGVTTITTANTGASDYTQTFQARTGTIANLDNVTYIGTTSVALNRASAALALTGISTVNGVKIDLGTNSLTTNIAIGTNSLQGANATNGNNVAIGGHACYSNTSGGWNTAIGNSALFGNTTGSNNTAIGNLSGGLISGSNNTSVGAEALKSSNSSNVGLGYFAGHYETGSNTFYVDNQDRTDTAGDKAGALLYGTFNATPANQTLKINATLTTQGNIELGHASDTTLSRVSAGVVAVEGKNIALNGTSETLTTGTIELGAASDTTITRVGAGQISVEGVNVMTVSSTDTISNKTLSDRLILAETASIALDPACSADEKWTGITIDGTAGATLAVGDLCYLDATAGEWLLADADAAASAGPVPLGLCVLAGGDGEATRLLLNGTMRSAAFPASIALGAQLFVSTTAGDITATAPTGEDDVVRSVGWAITTEPNTIYFNPSSDYSTVTV